MPSVLEKKAIGLRRKEGEEAEKTEAILFRIKNELLPSKIKTRKNLVEELRGEIISIESEMLIDSIDGQNQKDDFDE